MNSKNWSCVRPFFNCRSFSFIIIKNVSNIVNSYKDFNKLEQISTNFHFQQWFEINLYYIYKSFFNFFLLYPISDKYINILKIQFKLKPIVQLSVTDFDYGSTFCTLINNFVYTKHQCWIFKIFHKMKWSQNHSHVDLIFSKTKTYGTKLSIVTC